MPARFELSGVVRHYRSHEPRGAVSVVARGPRGEIVARTRSDGSGAFDFSIPIAPLRGLRWQDPDAPTLTIEIDRTEDAVELADDPPEWPLSDEPTPDLVLWVRLPGEGPLAVLDFATAHPPPQVPHEALWIAAVAGLASALRDGRLEGSDLARWLPPSSIARLAASDLGDATLELTRRLLSDADPDGTARSALEVLSDLAGEGVDDPWF